MSTNSAEAPQSPVHELDGQEAARSPVPPAGVPAASRGSPEGRYLGGPGKAVSRRVTDLRERQVLADARRADYEKGAERAAAEVSALLESHRGGDRTWLLRGFIPLLSLVEAGAAYLAVSMLGASELLAVAFSCLAAMIGSGTACIIADRRLNRMPVPAALRSLEGAFVAVLAALWFACQPSHWTGFGAAAVVAFVGVPVLLGIEEIVFETRTFAVYAATRRLACLRRQLGTAATRLAKIDAQIGNASARLDKHFLEYLLKTEGLALGEARQRADALKAALADRRAHLPVLSGS